jgi:hypothetical protein
MSKGDKVTGSPIPRHLRQRRQHVAGRLGLERLSIRSPSADRDELSMPASNDSEHACIEESDVASIRPQTDLPILSEAA